jgi:predicted transcriptional regulator
VRAVVEMAGRRPRRFQTLAVCRLRHPGGAEGPQVAEAAMLVQPLAGPGDPALPVGTTCRICPRTPCPGRREPSLIVDATTR